MLYGLKFIEDQVGLSTFWNTLTDIVVESEIVREITITQRLQIHVDDVSVRYSIVGQMLMKQVQQ